MSIEASWYGGQPAAKTILLRPLSYLFRGIVALRRALYRCHLKRSTRLPVPVIVVGNLTVGGTGKTPLVAWLAGELAAVGLSPGIISRGFGGQAKQWPQVVSADSDPALVGDEPVLLARRAQCPLVVGPNRVAAARMLLDRFPCQVLISDDGLQHYAMQRDVELIVVDGARQFGNGLCLPAGPLREPLSRLKQADFIISNGASNPNWLTMDLQPGDLINVVNPGQRLSLTEASKQAWQAIAGIGHPARFFQQLKTLGFNITTKAYPDHHAFTKSDIDFADTPVLMTEKDAVKCRQFADHRHWYLPVTATFNTAWFQQLLKRL